MNNPDTPLNQRSPHSQPSRKNRHDPTAGLVTAPQGSVGELEHRFNLLEEEKRNLLKLLQEMESKNQSLQEQSFALQQKVNSNGAYEKERAEFISAVAHELRTPLTSIKGYVDLILEGEAGDINDLQREFLSVIGANSDKLSRIIGDLLDVSRMEAGRLTFKPAIINLREIITNISLSVQSQVDTRKQKLVIEQPPGTVPVEVSADPERLVQALRSVLANAVQITPRGGTVHLSLMPDVNGEKAIVKIEDEGPGIAPGEISKVFDKFWHPNNKAWRSSSESGLGLAISKTIVDLHEGVIEVDNRPEGGSVFVVKMALINRLTLGDINRWYEQEAGQPERAVLVISRDPEFGRAVQLILKSANFQVIMAKEGEEVVSNSPAWQPDLIIENGSEHLDPGKSSIENVPMALRTAPTLRISLSGVEKRLLLANALAILPWPSPEQALLDNLLQVAGEEMTPEEKIAYKQTQPLLLVSDNIEKLRSLDKVLKDAGYNRVYRATQESDTLTLARRYRPALLLIDISGDETEERGPAFLELLREDPLLRDTPAVALTQPTFIAGEHSPDYRPGAAQNDNGKTLVAPSSHFNVVPKPLLQRRLINIARSLTRGS